MLNLKKLLLVILFSLIGYAGFSQAMWLLIFGDKLSNDRLQSGITVSMAGINMTGYQNANMAPDWAIGGFMDFALSKKKSPWAFSFDFTFKTPFGAKNVVNLLKDVINDSIVLDKETVKLNNTAFSLPLYLKYKTNLLGFGAGFQMSLMYKSQLKYSAKTNDGKTIKVSESLIKKMKKFDIGPFVMFEFFLKPTDHTTSMRLGLRYYYGLLSPVKDQSNVHNTTIMATLCVPIVGKKEVNQ